MKKRNLLLVATFMLSLFIAKAQNPATGDKIISLGIGFGNNFTAASEELSNTIPPLFSSFEYILKDNVFSDGKGAIGIGGVARFMNYKYSRISYSGTEFGTIRKTALKSAVASSSGYGSKYSRFIIGPRAYLHYSLLYKLDTYAALMLGLNNVSWGSGNTNNTHTSLTWSLFVGSRYYFTDNIAAMLELGYGATYVNIGIAYKFGN